MNASNYQQLAARTLIDRPDFDIADNDMMIIWNALGLAGEAGEVAETVKKGVLHQHGLDRDKMKKELGDVAWYLAALCTKLGLDLSEVLAANIEKLKVRYPEGYKPADSIARVDVDDATQVKSDAAALGKFWPSLAQEPDGADIFAGVYPVSGEPSPPVETVTIDPYRDAKFAGKRNE